MSELSNQLEKLSYQAQEISNQASNLAVSLVETSNGHGDFLVFGFTVNSSMFCWLLCCLVSNSSIT